MGSMIRHQICLQLYKHVESTKAEIAQNTDISFPTISKAIDAMVEAGEVRLVGLGKSSGGRRPSTYSLNAAFMTGAAVCLERDFSFYQLFDYEGQLIFQKKLPGVLEAGPELLQKQLQTIQQANSNLRVIVLGVPAPVKNGQVFHIQGYERFRDFNFQTFCEQQFGLSAKVENDMNATVSGYYDRGNYKQDFASVVYLYFGKNGPGAGIIVNGSVVRGSSSFSGEISFLPLSDVRNFEQLLTEALSTKDEQLRKRMLLESVSRFVVTFAATVNPHTIVCSNTELTAGDLIEIRKLCEEMIPADYLPELVSSDWEQDYFYGLQQLTIAKMFKEDE